MRGAHAWNCSEDLDSGTRCGICCKRFDFVNLSSNYKYLLRYKNFRMLCQRFISTSAVAKEVLGLMRLVDKSILLILTSDNEPRLFTNRGVDHRGRHTVGQMGVKTAEGVAVIKKEFKVNFDQCCDTECYNKSESWDRSHNITPHFKDHSEFVNQCRWWDHLGSC